MNKIFYHYIASAPAGKQKKRQIMRWLVDPQYKKEQVWNTDILLHIHIVKSIFSFILTEVYIFIAEIVHCERIVKMHSCCHICLCIYVLSKDMIFSKDMCAFFSYKERLKIPFDPKLWSEAHVKHWVQWAVRQFNLVSLRLADWNITGEQLCNLTLEEFQAKVPLDPGDVFWTHLELLKKCKFVGMLIRTI